jgi:hypothetical protein
MGFSEQAVERLTFKVQAANVIDANTNLFWYESSLENSPKITPNRILSQYSTIVANPPTSISDLQTNLIPGVLSGIVEDLTGTDASPIYTQLTQAKQNNNTTWVAYEAAGDRSSARLLNWINPSSVAQPNGNQSSAYGVQLYKQVSGAYIPIQATANQTTEVAWVWNYDQGLLLLAPDLIAALGSFSGLFIRAYRYIGTTGADSGNKNSLVVNYDNVLVDNNVSVINFKSNLKATLNNGVVDITDETFIFDQITGSNSWAITHNLNKYPSVTVVNTSDEEVKGGVSYTDSNSLTIDFQTNIAGKAYLN